VNDEALEAHAPPGGDDVGAIVGVVRYLGVGAGDEGSRSCFRERRRVGEAERGSWLAPLGAVTVDEGGARDDPLKTGAPVPHVHRRSSPSVTAHNRATVRVNRSNSTAPAPRVPGPGGGSR